MHKLFQNLIPYLFILTGLLFSCQKDGKGNLECDMDSSLDGITQRDFKMGFSTWPYASGQSARQNTYQFIAQNGDIYSEKLDDKIPWNSWLNGTPLPSEFILDIQTRKGLRPPGIPLILSASPFNTRRDNLAPDYNDSIPSYSNVSDSIIEHAYFLHLSHLIDEFIPDYMIISIEVNEFLLNNIQQWGEYKKLIANIRMRLKDAYPDLPLSESVTLHNWFGLPEDIVREISTHAQQSDFVSLSFYPYLIGLNNKNGFEEAFQLLHNRITKPIAFVETGHIAEDLELAGLNFLIRGDICQQKDYLEVLLTNAHQNNYEFVIWWTHRDFDELLETFPADQREIGRIWRDTGLIDEKGNERPAFEVWLKIFEK
ncbi:MAG TPA: hypothetical protein PKC30_03355 [Saprospiraceae bacterium]|nr:hypothetical protein [Saprospiraceae bacterium]